MPASAAYRSLVLSYSPLVYLELEDLTGSSTVVDSSGNGRTGTVIGVSHFEQLGLPDFDETTVSWESWYDSVNANQGKIIIPGAFMDGRTEFTICYWTDAWNSGNYDINYAGVFHVRGAEGATAAQFTDSSSTTIFAGGNYPAPPRDLVQSNSDFICVTYSVTSGLSKFYLNGFHHNPDAVVTAGLKTAIGGTYVVIGAMTSVGSANYFQRYDEVAILPVALTSTQVENLFNAGFDRPTLPTLGPLTYGTLASPILMEGDAPNLYSVGRNFSAEGVGTTNEASQPNHFNGDPVVGSVCWYKWVPLHVHAHGWDTTDSSIDDPTWEGTAKLKINTRIDVFTGPSTGANTGNITIVKGNAPGDNFVEILGSTSTFNETAGVSPSNTYYVRVAGVTTADIGYLKLYSYGWTNYVLPNDNVANAKAISGGSGLLTAIELDDFESEATFEPAEGALNLYPTSLTGFEASSWYKWVAPTTDEYFFTNRNVAQYQWHSGVEVFTSTADPPLIGGVVLDAVAASVSVTNPGNAYDMTLVGGSTALSTADGDTSYLEMPNLLDNTSTVPFATAIIDGSALPAGVTLAEATLTWNWKLQSGTGSNGLIKPSVYTGTYGGGTTYNAFTFNTGGTTYSDRSASLDLTGLPWLTADALRAGDVRVRLRTDFFGATFTGHARVSQVKLHVSYISGSTMTMVGGRSIGAASRSPYENSLTAALTRFNASATQTYWIRLYNENAFDSQMADGIGTLEWGVYTPVEYDDFSLAHDITYVPTDTVTVDGIYFFNMEEGEPGQFGSAVPQYDPAAAGAWFKWLGGDGTCTFDTIGTPDAYLTGDLGVDTVIDVFTGTDVGGLTLVATSDYIGSTSLSTVSFTSVESQLYYVRVSTQDISGGHNREQSYYVVNWDGPASTAAGSTEELAGHTSRSRTANAVTAITNDSLTFVTITATGSHRTRTATMTSGIQFLVEMTTDPYWATRTRTADAATLDVDPYEVPIPTTLPALSPPGTVTLTQLAGGGLPTGGYSYKVAAYRDDLSFITTTSPAATITLTTGNGTVQATWANVSGATGYVIFAKYPGDSDYRQIGLA